MLKDKLKHIKLLSLFEQISIPISSIKLEVVRIAPLTGAVGALLDSLETKQRNYFIGCSLSCCIILESLVGRL